MVCTYTTMIIFFGVGLFGFTAGLVGVFALLRQESLLGDTISHAALPGIAIMFLCTYSKNPWLLLFGGAIAGGIGVICMYVAHIHTTLKKDTLLGVILSVFFGFGLVLLTIIQKKSIAHQSILNKFLFGNAATILLEDVVVIGCVSTVIWIIIFFCFKEFQITVCDPLFARTLGYKLYKIDCLLLSIMIVTIVMGLQTVGVVLMSSMIIAPAAAARQWTKKLSSMSILSGMFGMSGSFLGTLISCSYDRVPTGPAIVIIMSFFVLFSLFFASHRGIVTMYIRRHFFSKGIE